MTPRAKERIQTAALHLFDTQGFAATSVAQIREQAGVSNGSFFHAYKTRDNLCADLYMMALRAYHTALLAGLSPSARDGIRALITAHLEWVVTSGPLARFLFEQTRPEWLEDIRTEQAAENAALAKALSDWRDPLTATGQLRPMPAMMFIAQLIGPAQVYCRAWLSGRDATDPREQAQALIDHACQVLLMPDQ